MLVPSQLLHKGAGYVETFKNMQQILGLQDPALQCNLYHTLVRPILSYGCVVLGVDAKRIRAF